MYFGIKER